MHKAHLVVKGFHQQRCIDFGETFNLVFKPPAIRIMLSLAYTYNCPPRQLDVRDAFLHDQLQEEVYV